MKNSFQYIALIFILMSNIAAQTFIDLGKSSRFQDTALGHHKRGRACIAADFDLDGLVDVYIGNPGDESYIMRNITGPGGVAQFQPHQILLSGDLAWGGVSFDYDNDGDYDLFIACGGNEGIGFDYLFRNEWIVDGIVTGNLEFVDVTSEAGVAGPVPADTSSPIMTSSANAVLSDYDRDGDVDIFVNGNSHISSLPDYPELIGRNTLWQNNGDGTFIDVSSAAGLATVLGKTRHSTFLDFDNDGDSDLFENMFLGSNILWENNGDGTFTDVTSERSASGHDLSYPTDSYASAAADFNNDGWEDIIIFSKKDDSTSIYAAGHALFLNGGENGFENIVFDTNLNDEYDSGVMGCQVGDINGDGIPDVYLGNGSPKGGKVDQLFLSDADAEDPPVYINTTHAIDFPAEIDSRLPVPPYPYRTHGTTFIDADGDGSLEIAVVNGGPSALPDSVREPNRLFKIIPDEPYQYLNVLLKGNGSSVSKDAIGSRVAVRLSKEGKNDWLVYRTLFAGSAFSAQNGFKLHFGLSDADSIKMVKITWPDGSLNKITEGLFINSSITVTLDENGKSVKKMTDHDDAIITVGEARADDKKTVVSLRNQPNPFNPSTTISFELNRDSWVTMRIFNILGEEVKTLLNGHQTTGVKNIVWDGTDNHGASVASGTYIYRIRAGEFVASQKMMFSK